MSEDEARGYEELYTRKPKEEDESKLSIIQKIHIVQGMSEHESTISTAARQSPLFDKTIEQLEEQLEEEWKRKKLELLKERVIQNILLKDKPQATEDITKYVLENNIIKTTRNDENSEVWIYREGIYVPEGKTHIKEICRIATGIAFTTHFANVVIAKIETDTYIEQEEFFNQQNKYPEIIPVQNGILNIKTRELKEFTSKIYFFNKLPVKYNPTIKCPIIMQFLKDITKKEEDIKVIGEMVGFSLLKDYRYEKSFMLYGEHGRNGKSKLLSLQQRLLGAENITSLNLQTIEKEGFAIAELHNKLVNISGDISKEAINNTGKFKELTGRDPQSADRKFKTRLSFTSYAKMIFAGNELPPINTNSDAFWLRWVIIEFPYQFLPPKEINSLTDDEKKRTKIQDPMIMDKLTTDEELSGFLNFALDGFERLENNKDFSCKDTAKDVKKSWMRKSNSVASFIMDYIEEDYDNMISKKDFKSRYLSFCKSHRIRPVSDKVIKITLENELSCTSLAKSSFENGLQNKVYYWEGINFTEKKEEPFISFTEKLTKNDTTGQGGHTGQGVYPIGKVLNLPKSENTLSTVSTLSTSVKEEDFVLTSFIENFNIDGKTTDEELMKKSSLEYKKMREQVEVLKQQGDIVESKPGVYQILK